MKINLFLLMLILFSSCLWAYPSLFFTEKETENIKQNKHLKMDKSMEYIYLSSIVYVDEKHWALWVNQQIIHASDSPEIHNFRIERVSPFAAEFSWVMPHLPRPIRFKLLPHQMAIGNKKREIKIVKIN